VRAVVQRVVKGRVLVEDREVGRIGHGLVVLLGVKKEDSEADARYLADKVCNLRVFEDDAGKMNRSLLDIGGSVLVVSQFTLLGDARKGRRPSFSEAADPVRAIPLIDAFVSEVKNRGVEVSTGEFGEHMMVEIHNDGPCTILLDSERVF